MHASLTPSAGPLAGMRVIEVSSFVAAPLGGMTLAQLGAEVVRVDPVRRRPGHQAVARHPRTDEPLLGRPQQGQEVGHHGLPVAAGPRHAPCADLRRGNRC